MNNIYYVYMYLRDKDSENGPKGSPYYIGKGKDDRIFSNQRTANKPANNSNIRFIIENISEDDAFMWEVFWIAEFGRIDLGTGCLRNLTDGGEGTSGHIQPKEVRDAASARMKGNKFWLGKTHTDDAKKKVSEAQKGNKHGLGHKKSKEARKKISDSMLGNEKFLGKTHSDSAKEKIRAANINKVVSEETKNKIRATLKKTLEEKSKIK
jgi:hypothetical protein